MNLKTCPRTNPSKNNSTFLKNPGRLSARDKRRETEDIRRSVRKDRTDMLIQNLEECLWYDIKKAKAGFIPNHVKLRKTDGSIAKSIERPEVLAEHYEKKQWGIDEHRNKTIRTNKIFNYESPIDHGHINVYKLLHILKKMKNAKAPGPDGIPMEFFKWMRSDTDFCIKTAQIVCDILNKCIDEETIPQHLEFAQVVTLYKNGNVEDPGNYRDRKSTRLNSSHPSRSRMPSSA